jgi:hypothetical protein
VAVLYAQHHEAPTVIHDPRLGDFVLGQVNVKFRSGVSSDRVESIVHDVDGQVLRRVENWRCYVAGAVGERNDTKAVLNQLQQYPEVEHAKPERVLELY